ncbi:electron transport complex subunit RsxC [Peptoniphilus sp. KCTC 25270]|uniref:electron transport complex subunit RsxC n=1 Tax=Peptoniphilus sp. KCTC 25270 TaxID=2897414 RepID=UPI001E32D886|nr:electron transport complex subunit RsxC [Peptoniphilus sp. KCTC 25270]MCD1146900.1 electron transport complex subunit RsxC [Peptoniphilus sp. KCTC 25270]
MAKTNLTFSVGGVHFDEHKEATEGIAIEKMPTPKLVRIPMSQHIGAPCQPTVSVGDHVYVGQIVGNTEAFVSAAVHSSVSGTVVGIEKGFAADSRFADMVVIESDGKDELDPSIKPIDNYKDLSIDEIMTLVKNAGIVGMGGAGFPLHAKLKGVDPVLDVVILNGAECEPFLTCDHRLMLEQSDELLGSLRLFADLYNTEEAYVAIEENKPDAIEKLNQMVANEYKGLKVATMKTKYPQGDSKRQSEAVVGRIVPQNGVTNDVGVFLTNVATAKAYYDLITKGIPSYERIITVSGSGIVEPKNIAVRIGTPVRDILEFCGGVKDNTIEIICGGPMTGKSVFNLDAPITKTTSGILVFTDVEIQEKVESPCIQCSRCVDHCPANINPTKINAAIKRNRVDLCQEYHADQCMECGICSFVCPAKRYLSESLKLAKREVRAFATKK